MIPFSLHPAVPFVGQEDKAGRWLLATVVALTLLNSGVSVAFSYIGRDFWTALSNKDPAQFNIMLQRYPRSLADCRNMDSAVLFAPCVVPLNGVSQPFQIVGWR